MASTSTQPIRSGTQSSSTDTDLEPFFGYDSGSAIKAVGRHFQRTFENAGPVKRRYHALKMLFPTNEMDVERTKEFQDLLEFARNDLHPGYPDYIHRGSRKLLRAQIVAENPISGPLVKYLQSLHYPSTTISIMMEVVSSTQILKRPRFILTPRLNAVNAGLEELAEMQKCGPLLHVISAALNTEHEDTRTRLKEAVLESKFLKIACDLLISEASYRNMKNIVERMTEGGNSSRVLDELLAPGDYGAFVRLATIDVLLDSRRRSSRYSGIMNVYDDLYALSTSDSPNIDPVYTLKAIAQRLIDKEVRRNTHTLTRYIRTSTSRRATAQQRMSSPSFAWLFVGHRFFLACAALLVAVFKQMSRLAEMFKSSIVTVEIWIVRLIAMMRICVGILLVFLAYAVEGSGRPSRR